MDNGQSTSGKKMAGIFSGPDQFQTQSDQFQPQANQFQTQPDQFQSQANQNSFQNPAETPYFTAGVGDAPVEANNFEPENNLDEENWQRSLEISTPVDLPSPEKMRMGDALRGESPESLTSASENPMITSENPIITSENPAASPETPSPSEAIRISPESSSELGKITPFGAPPRTDTADTTAKYNPINIRTTGDRLEKSTIPEVDNIINELEQTGSVSNFYDEIRGTDERPGMMEVNLENSYGRKLGQNQIKQTKTGGSK